MSDNDLNPYDLNEVGRAQRERAQGGLRAACGILGPRPDDEEPPEVTIRRGRGDSDAELYDYMRGLWAEQKAENARLKAQFADAIDCIAMFNRTIIRAERIWKERHPDTELYPDVPDLIVWLAEQVKALAARRCETCGRSYYALGRLCCDVVNPDGEWVEPDHFCGYYEPEGAADDD